MGWTGLSISHLVQSCPAAGGKKSLHWPHILIFTEDAPKVELSAGGTTLDRSVCVKTPAQFLSDTSKGNRNIFKSWHQLGMNRPSSSNSSEFAMTNYLHFLTSWNDLLLIRNSKHPPISKSTAFKKYLAAGHCLDLTGFCIPWKKNNRGCHLFEVMISKNERGKLQVLLFLYHKVIFKKWAFQFYKAFMQKMKHT